MEQVEKIIEFDVRKAQTLGREALDSYIAGDTALSKEVKRTREFARAYGAAAKVLREQAGNNDRKFHKLLVDAGMKHGVAANNNWVTEAMWLDDMFPNVREHDGTESGCPYHNPIAIRQWFRKLGFDWAKTKRKVGVRAKKKSDAKPGWILALETAWGKPLPVGWRSDQLAHKSRGSKRAMLEKEYGKPIPDRVEPAEALEIAAALQRILDRDDVRDGKGKDKLDDIRKGMKETQQQKFDRAVERAAKLKQVELEHDFQQKFDAAVEVEVLKRLPDEAKERIEREQRITKRAEEAEQLWRGRMQHARKGVTLLMENWRLFAGCLHPDRAPEDRREKFKEATQVLNEIREALKFVDYEQWGKS